jgi:multiple sugar transport system substrate-binding protein
MISRRQLLGAGALTAAGALADCRCSRGARGHTGDGQTSAQRAVKLARQYSGSTLNVSWEGGMQAAEPLQFSGPRWEELTGIRINLIELGSPLDLYRHTIEEHWAGTGAFDCGMVAPAWVPDLVGARALEPLDELVARYMVPTDLDDVLPLYRTLGFFKNRRYGLSDDGDVLLLYYRRDLFSNEDNQREFKSRFGRPLADPQGYGWQQFSDAAHFFTQPPHRYGMGPFNRDLRWGWFQALLRRNGGQFFDPVTMKPGVGEAPGIETMARLAELDQVIPPGTFDVSPKEGMLSTYGQGASAMASFWPPLGRWVEGYGISSRAGPIPRPRVAGKTGYALLPGGVTEIALGYLLSVFSRSRQKVPAYLFIQWLNSPEVSLERVMLPFALRDPFRISHIRSPSFRRLWPNAGEYLDLLAAAGNEGALVDLIIPGHAEYAEAFFVASTQMRLGSGAVEASQTMAARWDAITQRLGRNRQRAEYLEYLKRPGATIGAYSRR